MLSFLNSLVLPALIAALIPLIIHLLNRQRTKKIQFSSLRFLKLLENHRIRQVKLYHILLIIFRTLFILLLVLAFSRPTFTRNLFGFDSSAATTAVFLVDDSYSMLQYEQARTRFDISASLVSDLGNLFSNQDRLYINSATRPVPDQIPSDEKLDIYFKNYAPGFSTPDFSEALEKAFDVLREYPNLNRELYMVSDFQFPARDVTARVNNLLQNQPVRFYFVNPVSAQAINNTSIDSVVLKNQLFEKDKPVRLEVRLRNHNQEEAVTKIIHLYRDDQRIAMDQKTIPPGEQESVEMIFIPKQTGEQFLRLELEEDDLFADNFYYLNLNVPSKIRALVVSDEYSKFLSKAMGILDNNTLLAITRARFDNWQGFAFDNFDVIFLIDPPELNNATTRRLRTYFEQNKNVIIVPGNRFDYSTVNSIIRPFVSENVFTRTVSVTEEGTFFSLAPLSSVNDLFSSLFMDNQNRFDSPQIEKYFVQTTSGSPLLLFTNDDPFLSMLNTTEDGGVIYLLSAGFGPEWGDFHIKGFFIPFLYRLMYIAGQRTSGEGQLMLTGSDYTIQLSNQSVNSEFYLALPSGERRLIVPEEISGRIRFNFPDLVDPGHYKFYENDNLSAAFSVNLSSKEFHGPYLQPQDINGTITTITPEKKAQESILEARSGFEMWPLFVILALSALLAEIVLIKKIEGRPESNIE